MNGTTNGTLPGKLDPLVWLRANLKLILLGGNALAVLILLYLLVTQLIFDFRTRSLLSSADRIEKQSRETKAPPPSDKPRPERERRGLPPLVVHQEGERSSETVAMTTTTSGTAATTAPVTNESAGFDPMAFGAFDEMMMGWVPEAVTASTTAPATTSAATLSPVGSTSATAAAAETTGTAHGESVDPSGFGFDGFGDWGGFGMAAAAEMGLTSGTQHSSGTLAAHRGNEPPGTDERSDRSGRKGSRRGEGADAADSSNKKSGDPNAKSEEEKKREKFTQLEKRALFGEPRPEAKPPMVEAILGQAALVNGQWVAAGGRVGDAKVLEILDDKIVLEDGEGKRQEYAMLAGGEGGPGMPGGMMPGMANFRGRFSDRGGMTMMSAESSARPSAALSLPASGSDAPQIPDAILQRLTGPGGPFEGESRDQLVERWRRMRDARMMGGGGMRGAGPGGNQPHTHDSTGQERPLQTVSPSFSRSGGMPPGQGFQRPPDSGSMSGGRRGSGDRGGMTGGRGNSGPDRTDRGSDRSDRGERPRKRN